MEKSYLLKSKVEKQNVKHVPFNDVIPADIDLILHMGIMHIRYKRKYHVAVCNPLDLTLIKRLKPSHERFVREATLLFKKQLRSRGYIVREIRSDPGSDIKAVILNLPCIRFNPSGIGMHKPVVERKIQTIRERIRANDFDCKPVFVGDRLLDHQVHYVIQRLNMELFKNRLDQVIPWVAFTGIKLDMNTDFSLSFMDYM